MSGVCEREYVSDSVGEGAIAFGGGGETLIHEV